MANVNDFIDVERQRKNLVQANALAEDERPRNERVDIELARQIIQPHNAHNALVEELQQMRHMLQQQQRQLDALRAAPPRRVEDNAGMLNGLVHGFQSLKLDVKSPKFDNELLTNPRAFVNQLEEYFLLKRVDEAFKIFIVENALDGRSKIWFQANRQATFPRIRRSD